MRWPPRSRPRAWSSPRSRPRSGRAYASASSAGRRASRSSYWRATRNMRDEQPREPRAKSVKAKGQSLSSVSVRTDQALRHAARHEATDRHPEIAAQRPYHGSAYPVRFGDDSFVGNVDPIAVKPDAIMSVGRFPINIADRRAVGIRTARALAAFEAVKPLLEGRIGVTPVRIPRIPRIESQCQH